MSSLTTWNLVSRGTVTESWSAFAARIRGEVERRLATLLRVYGGVLRARPNMVRVVISLTRFLDISGSRIDFGTMHALR